MQERTLERRITNRKELEEALLRVRFDAELALGMGKEITVEIWKTKEATDVARKLPQRV